MQLLAPLSRIAIRTDCGQCQSVMVVVCIPLGLINTHCSLIAAAHSAMTVAIATQSDRYASDRHHWHWCEASLALV